MVNIMLYEYLKENYQEGEPIFTEDITLEGMKKANLNQQLKGLADKGLIRRFDKGVYFIPRSTRLSAAAGPSADEVAREKYVKRGDTFLGYYSGATFANQLGISLQVPAKVEIVSNKMSAIVREISIGKRVFIVRSARVSVTNENACVLQLLDLLKDLDFYLDGDYEIVKEKVSAYVVANKITREAIDRYIRAFPDSTFRNYYEMELDHVLA